MSLTEQSLLHNLSVNDKGKLIWNSSYDLLRKFVDEVLNLPNGEWSSLGGDAKLFESEGVSIRWYAKAKTITLNGRCQSETEKKLYSIASISKELAEVNKQNSDTDCALGNSFISLAEVTSKPVVTTSLWKNICNLLKIGCRLYLKSLLRICQL